MADLQEIIEIRELPTKDSPSDNDYLVVDDETLTNRVKYSNFKSSMTKEVEEKIEQETNDRESADNTLQSNINTEVSDRKSADNDLQSQIDAITSRSDVVDVVATKADLDAYSKDITVDDIIKVLQDETQDNATSYYRNTAKSKPYVWELVGVLGPYYTQGQVDKLIDDEAQTRESADTSLQKSINEEASTREKADNTLQSNIDNEVKARQSADNTLQANIDNETKARTNADTTLQENIDNEKSQRLLNVDSLRTDINKCKKVFEYLNPTDTTYLIRHGLSTKDFLINVYSINGKDLNPTIERLDGDNVQLTFEEVPSDFRVVIFAINEWALNKLAFNLPI